MELKLCLDALLNNYDLFLLKGIIERDQIVFQEARQRGIPIFMLTSGGYQVEKINYQKESALYQLEADFI